MMADTMKLGELIDALKPLKRSAEVGFDFCYLRPNGIDSYRGYYDHLALGYDEKTEMTVGKLLKICEEANGETYTGYKGGEFKMNRDTPVWVSNYGEAGHTGIVAVVDAGWKIVLTTKWVDV